MHVIIVAPHDLGYGANVNSLSDLTFHTDITQFECQTSDELHCMAVWIMWTCSRTCVSLKVGTLLVYPTRLAWERTSHRTTPESISTSDRASRSRFAVRRANINKYLLHPARTRDGCSYLVAREPFRVTNGSPRPGPDVDTRRISTGVSCERVSLLSSLRRKTDIYSPSLIHEHWFHIQ
jgi:hypothetical protein